MINVNHAGFTVCLFYGALGRVEPGPIYESSCWQHEEVDRGDLEDVGPDMPGYNGGLSEVGSTAEQRCCCRL